ncbi:uncharacterized protein LOC135219175 [Macrobrachium nipponense]|uniref:uncharacterized protein LOC135219175 n=1 Tax=Macrobrachium nipponense TaxID=159736 RepID=UPI0030C7CB6A
MLLRPSHLLAPSVITRALNSSKMRGLAFVIIFLLSVCNAGAEPAHNEVMVVEGHEANLPCVTVPTLTPYRQKGGEDEDDDGQDLSKLLPERPKLIIWYKDGIRSSIYSYDGRDPRNERHWSPRRSLGGSISLTLPASPYARPQLAFLNIGHIHETDAGLYHCKVEFQRGPSKSTYTKLVVVAPPTAPTIEVWAGGRWLHTTHETSTATVEVGTELTLRCSTSSGKPLPKVSWWRGGQQLLSESTEHEATVSSTVNVTVVPEDAHTPIVCQATNTHLVPPLRTPLLLLVLSPPKWLRVIGADVEMSAGTTYVVECRCVGARPPPVITWTVGGDELTDAISTTDSEGETTSRLRFTPKPAHSGTHITCTAHPPDHAHQAASPHATPTLWVKSDSVPLKILYKPEVQLDIQPLKKQERVGPGRQSNHDDFDAESPSRPPPFSPSDTIRQNQMLTSDPATKPGSPKSAMNDGDGKDTGKWAKDKDKLETKKKSLVTKEISKGKGVVTVDEFTGVVLQCNVRANPPAYHVSWHRNGIPLSPVTSPGLLLGNMSAVFQNLSRKDAGNLTCTAHNQEGSSRSRPVLLHVNHGPDCARDAAKILGVPRHHTLNVTCEVDAYPPPDSFSWALRSSRGILAVPPEMIHFSGTTSWIVYTPRANVDFGDLLCWAHTPVGRQDDPCVAQLVSAEKPDTPENCKVTKRSQDKLSVSCKAAHDGGLPQTFFMKVFHGGLQVANSTSVNPEITVYDLEPDTRYRLTIWSANTHGTSTGHTNLYTSTLPSNTSSTTSSMNGHSSNNHRGLLSKFGSSMLAVVVVVTVVGVVVGIIVGIMVRKIDGRSHHSGRDQEEEEEEGEERPPTLINNNQINVAMAGIGRRVPKCLEPLGTSTTRYDVMTNPGGKSDNHVYDDPITLRGRTSPEGAPMEEENIEVTHHDIRYPPFSMTTTDYFHQSHNFSWHLPNSRLLRNKFNQRYQTSRGCPRKPVRVETPRLPEFDISTTVTTRRKFQAPSGMEFRLILIPETSKMLQVALERDTRLASYLCHDSHVSNSPMKFPTITEEDEQKNADALDDHSVTPYESTPDDFTIENGQSDTSELLPKCCNVEARAMVHSENQELNRNRLNYGRYRHLQERTVSDCAFDDLQITPEKIPTLTIYGNGHGRQSRGNQTKRPISYHLNETRTTLQNIANVRASTRLQRNSFPDVTFRTDNDDDSRMKVALLGRQDGRGNETPKRAAPSNPLVGKLGRHHPYGMPVSNIRKGIRSPQAPPVKSMDNKVVQSGHPPPANMIPTSPFSLLRKPKVGVTSLLSLVSSSSSTSSLSSSYASKRGRGSRETTTSPLSEGRRRVVSCGSKKPTFRNLKARPRSIHLISGPEQVLQWWGEEEGDNNDCQSSSTPSSPRSSTSSSCFPYSSMSSSPVSSFYSSENSLSISTAFSHSSSSSSSFCMSSGSGSSSTSSSPFSSFLSPSLTTPASSSVLSLSSCSPTPESVMSGHITPT